MLLQGYHDSIPFAQEFYQLYFGSTGVGNH
jgi:hypothetical protein